MEILPPPGGDQNRGPELLAVTWTFTSFAVLVVTLKIYTRVNILRDLALDDFFVFFSLVRVFLSALTVRSFQGTTGEG